MSRIEPNNYFLDETCIEFLLAMERPVDSDEEIDELDKNFVESRDQSIEMPRYPASTQATSKEASPSKDSGWETVSEATEEPAYPDKRKKVKESKPQSTIRKELENSKDAQEEEDKEFKPEEIIRKAVEESKEEQKEEEAQPK